MASVKKYFKEKPTKVKFLVEVDKKIFERARAKKRRQKKKWGEIIEAGMESYIDG